MSFRRAVSLNPLHKRRVRRGVGLRNQIVETARSRHIFSQGGLAGERRRVFECASNAARRDIRRVECYRHQKQ
jgi:hypothetical protein